MIKWGWGYWILVCLLVLTTDDCKGFQHVKIIWNFVYMICFYFAPKISYKWDIVWEWILYSQMINFISGRSQGNKSARMKSRITGHWTVSLTTRWRHQMETFSAWLTLCVGNSSATGELPSQRPVTRTFDIFFDLRLSKRFSKQSWRRWFETLLCSLWRQCNEGRVMRKALPNHYVMMAHNTTVLIGQVNIRFRYHELR